MKRKSWARYTERINQIRIAPADKQWLHDKSFVYSTNPTEIMRAALASLRAAEDADTILLKHLPEHPYKPKEGSAAL